MHKSYIILKKSSGTTPYVNLKVQPELMYFWQDNKLSENMQRHLQPSLPYTIFGTHLYTHLDITRPCNYTADTDLNRERKAHKKEERLAYLMSLLVGAILFVSFLFAAHYFKN